MAWTSALLFPALSRKQWIALLALTLFTIPASADSAYVVNANSQFGTVDLGTGAFQQIGPDMPEPGTGLVPGPNGSLLTLRRRLPTERQVSHFSSHLN